MSVCAQCGLDMPGDSGLCLHHHTVYGEDWHVGNKIMCDFFHRGVVPRRLTVLEREDPWSAEGACDA